MTNYQFKLIKHNDVLFPQVFALREQVLRLPLGLSLYAEDTSDDVEDDIFVALVNDEVVACVMMKPVGCKEQKLRQMAIALTFQNKGLGKQLVQFAEAAAKEKGYQKISLHARQHAIGFYEKLSYQAFGDIFYEVGLPHQIMLKNL